MSIWSSGRRTATRRSSSIGSPKCMCRPPLQEPRQTWPSSRMPQACHTPVASPPEMTVEFRGNVLAPDPLGPCRVVVEDDRIAAIEPLRDAPEGTWIVPGLVDIQLNGAFGVDFANPEGLDTARARIAASGVTTFLATLVSASPGAYADPLAALVPDATPGLAQAGRRAPGGAVAVVDLSRRPRAGRAAAAVGRRAGGVPRARHRAARHARARADRRPRGDLAPHRGRRRGRARPHQRRRGDHARRARRRRHARHAPVQRDAAVPPPRPGRRRRAARRALRGDDDRRRRARLGRRAAAGLGGEGRVAVRARLRRRRAAGADARRGTASARGT